MKARERELARMNTSSLRQLAQELGVSNRSKMAKAALVKAIARQEQAPEPEPEPEPEAKPQAKPPESGELEEGQTLTVEELRRITAASTESLEMILGEELEPYLWEAVAKELATRRERAEAQAKREAAKTPLEMYTVTKGGRFIANGQITQLPVGSMIGPHTHNLAEVKRQGIEFEPRRGVVVSLNQMGQQVSRAV